MRKILAAAAISALALLPAQAFAQEDTQAPPAADSTPGQLDNVNTDDQSADQAFDAFPDSTRIPEPSESGPPVDTAPGDTKRANDGDEPH